VLALAMTASAPGFGQDGADAPDAEPAQGGAADAADPADDASDPDAPLPPGLTPPDLVESVEAEYPTGAFDADVEADVLLQIDIGADGAVSNIVPVDVVYYTYDAEGYAVEDPRSVDDDPYGFVPPAIDAVAQYRFDPAVLVDDDNPEGVAVPVQVTWRVGFVIDQEETIREVDETEDYADETDDVVAIDTDGPENFTGRLLERGTREPLAGFFVGVSMTTEDGRELYAETATGFDGRFSFRGLPAGAWRVVVDEADYFPVDLEEDISRTDVTDVTYFIERNSYGANVSRTTAERPRREVTRRTIEISEVQRIPGNNNDAVKVVQNLPGVARAAFGGGDVIVRGSAPEDTGFLLDGMNIPAVYHFGGLRAVFPTESLEEINFYPGGFSSEYGRVTGGVVEVTSNLERPERVGGHVDANVFDTGVWFETPITERLHLQVGARRSYIDAILSPLADTLGLNFTTAPRYYDYQNRLVYQINNDHRASVLVFGSDDLLDLVTEDQSELEPGQRGGIRARSFFHGALFRLESDLSDTVTNDFRYKVNSQGLFFSLGQDLRFDLDVVEHQFRDTVQWRPSDLFAMRTGLDIQIITGDIEVRLPLPPKEGEEAVDFQASEVIFTQEPVDFYQPAAFTELEIAPLDNLRIIPGARMEYYRTPGDWAFDGRLAVRYGVSDDVTVKGAIGTFHQPPTPDETSDAFGNPDLRLEQAVHYVLGTEWSVTEYLSANVEVFYKDLNDLIASADGTREQDGETVSQIYDNSGEGRVYGAEFLLRHDLNNRFFGWIAYTLSRSERRDGTNPDWRLFDFDQTHILTLLGSYNLPRNWSIGARFRLVSGNPDTPIVGSVYDVDANSYVRVAGETNSERQPVFHQLDVRVDKRWIYDRWTLNLYLDLQNAYNRMNQEDIIYNYDYTESERLTGLPIIPSLGIRAEF